MRPALTAILAALLLGVAARGYVAASTTYIWDEERDWIPVAQSISLDPAEVHLPVRAGQHPALPAYFIRLGSLALGSDPVGYRLGSLLAGLLTLVVVGRLAWEWAGASAAFWAVGLLAVNEYHIAVSALALEKAFYLLFATVSVYLFCRFLRLPEGRLLYGCAASAGLAFLCKEIAALLVPCFLVALWASGNAKHLRGHQAWLAVVVFVAVILPDLLWQIFVDGAPAVAAGYGEHLGRIRGVGVTYQPLVFFERPLVREAFEAVGRPFYDFAQEYPSMNPVMGALLLAGVGSGAVRWWRGESRDATAATFLCVFGFVFLFFTFVRTGSPHPGMDPVVWFWVDLTLIPALLLAARMLADRGGRIWKGKILAAGAGVGMVLAVAGTFGGSLGMPSRSLGTCPERLWPPDGGMRRVTATIESCAVCDEVRAAHLAPILVEESGEVRNADGGEVEGAEIGTHDRSFRLEADLGQGGSQRRYVVRYVTGETSGPDTLAASVGVRSRSPWRRRFWACPSDQEAGPGEARERRPPPAATERGP